MDMDKLDYLILSELLKDAQMSFMTIAKKLGISPCTVRKRYQRMKREGVIKKSIVSIDLSKLGYQGKAFLMITNSPSHDKSATIEALMKIKNVMVITEIIGPFDILAIAPVTDLNSIKTLADAARKLPSVQRVEITCISDTAFPVNSSFGQVLSQKCLESAANSPDS
ncbi:Lrp/AsnC family transcriptional regulator [Candidatus Bathyarchaeota archaeon]|nr:Lrp/AsnC family transcriptional regulator [Candidatus Bathyarchaeota archaeon]